jgi:hypothetical protein
MNEVIIAINRDLRSKSAASVPGKPVDGQFSLIAIESKRIVSQNC